LRAASSLGKCPFVLIALRSCRFNASIAFVVCSDPYGKLGRWQDSLEQLQKCGLLEVERAGGEIRIGLGDSAVAMLRRRPR
jgi:hypothetical protein